MKKIFISIITISMVFFIFTNNSFAGLADSLDAHYPLNGNGQDFSGNYNTATFYGDVCAIVNRSGKNDYALTFDGTGDYLQAADSISLDVDTSDFSVSFWMKTAFITDVVMLDKRGPSDNTGYVVYTSSMKPTIRLGFGVLKYSYISTATLPTNNWAHIVVTVDRDISTGIKFYVDKVLSGESNPTPFEGDDLSTNSPLVMGASWSHGYELNGCLDDVRIYKRILTTSEIEDLYDEINPNPISYTAIIGIDDQGTNGYGDVATLSKNINGVFVQIDDSHDVISPITITGFFGGSLNWLPKSVSIVDLGSGNQGIAVMAYDEANEVAKIHTYDLGNSEFIEVMTTLPLFGN